MILADIITEISSELNRTDIDTRIKRWIQQSINYIYGVLEFESLLRSATLTTVTDTETLSLPSDYGEIISLVYAPGDGTGYPLTQITPNQFFSSFSDQNISSFVKFFCIYDGLIYLSPLPSSTYTLILRYRISSPNVYVHEFNLEDSDTAPTEGVQVYIDEDGGDSNKQIGKLYFISPTETDGKIMVNSIDGHSHEITIYHSSSAATLGVPFYFDEDGANKNSRNLFISPTGKDCIIQTSTKLNHSHYIRFIDDDSAASSGVGVYLDEDQSDKTKRLRFVSSTNTNGTGELVPSLDLQLPPFVEQYDEGIILSSISKGLRWKKEYEASNAVKSEFNAALSSYQRSEERKAVGVTEAKPFGARDKGIWDSLKFPNIDDGL